MYYILYRIYKGEHLARATIFNNYFEYYKLLWYFCCSLCPARLPAPHWLPRIIFYDFVFHFSFSNSMCRVALLRSLYNTVHTFWFDFNSGHFQYASFLFWLVVWAICGGGGQYAQYPTSTACWCWCWNMLSFSADRCRPTFRLFCLINLLICQADETDGTTTWHHGNPKFWQWTAGQNKKKINNNNSKQRQSNPTNFSPLLHQLYIHFSGTHKTRY